MIGSVIELGRGLELADAALRDVEEYLSSHADDGDALMPDITKLAGEVATRADRTWERLRALLIARGQW